MRQLPCVIRNLRFLRCDWLTGSVELARASRWILHATGRREGLLDIGSNVLVADGTRVSGEGAMAVDVSEGVPE